MEDTKQVIFYEPWLLLVEVGEGRFSTVLQHGDGGAFACHHTRQGPDYRRRDRLPAIPLGDQTPAGRASATGSDSFSDLRECDDFVQYIL